MGRAPLPIDIANMRDGRATSNRTVSSNDVPLVSPEFSNYVKGQINSRIEKYTNKGYFIFPFFIRYAIRLFDGSLVKHSPPILILPSKFIPFQAGIHGTTDTIYVYFQDVHKLQISFSATDISDYADIIEGVDVFISDSIYTYNYSGDITGHRTNPLYDATSQFTRTPIWWYL